MKKALQFILILIVAIGSFLSPISGAFNKNGEFNFQKNEARAAFGIVLQPPVKADITKDSVTLTVNISAGGEKLNDTDSYELKIGTDKDFDNIPIGLKNLSIDTTKSDQ